MSCERDKKSPKVRGPWSSSQSSAPILGTSWTGRTELDNHDTRTARVHEGIARAGKRRRIGRSGHYVRNTTAAIAASAAPACRVSTSSAGRGALGSHRIAKNAMIGSWAVMSS